MRWTICLVIVASVSVLAGCGPIGGTSSAPPELIEPAGVELSMAEVGRGTLMLALRGTGVVIPEHTEYLHFEVGGTLGEVLVERGSRVQAGDVLLRLEDEGYELERMRRQLALEERQSALAEAIRSGESDESSLHILQLNVQIEQRKLDRLEERQSKLELVSPADGVVTFQNVGRIGSAVEAYQPLIGISPTDRKQVNYVGDFAQHSSLIHIGMPVRLMFEGTELEGSVAEAPWTLQAGGDPVRGVVNSRTLRFAWEGEPPAGMEFGDSVEFVLELEKREDALIIPRSALRNYQGRNFVLVVEEGIRREIDVAVGLITPTKVEIVSGLEEGQRIVNSFY